MPAIAQRRSLNELVTRYWTLMSRVYNFPLVQRHIYSPAQTDTIAQLCEHDARRVADIACGTGILASRIQAELHQATVFGVDMSDGMLAKARARCAQVQWRKAPAEQLPFADSSLDAVVTTSAFHFFDQPAALAEFYRVLVPGGMASVATICPRSGAGPATAPANVARHISRQPPRWNGCSQVQALRWSCTARWRAPSHHRWFPSTGSVWASRPDGHSSAAMTMPYGHPLPSLIDVSLTT